MFKGLGNIASLLKNAQNIGGKMGEIAESLRTKRVVGSAGGQMVTVEANGVSEILKITIDPLLIENNEWEMVQELLPAAINDAIAKAKQLHVEAMQSLTGGMELPGLEDMMKKFNPNNDG